MQKVLTAEEMREVDQLTTEKYGIPSILLMENAAHAAARVITEKLGGSVKDKRFNVLCGTGNNGGDGAALARVLWTLGARVTLLLFGKVHETKGDAKINFEIFKKLASIDYSSEFIECKKNSFQETFHRVFFDKTWGNYDAVVDAMFGTGLNKPLNEDFAYIADVLCNKQKWKQRKNENLIVSLDIPSGLNADSAEQIGENIHADVTVTFTAPKIANVMSPASSLNGELYIANIGSQSLLGKVKTQTFVVIPDGIRGLLCKTQVQTNSYKKTRGTALIIAGSKNYSGAA
ncbi:MAG: NAD(P)H-hydrate epimerase, partial [Pyrinomonadaceae bacterium]